MMKNLTRCFIAATASALMLLADKAQAQSVDSTQIQVFTRCRVIRFIEYPIKKRPPSPSEKRVRKHCLLNICLPDKTPMARPMIEVMLDGKKAYRTFAVEKMFESRKEAEDYAAAYGIIDAKYE